MGEYAIDKNSYIEDCFRNEGIEVVICDHPMWNKQKVMIDTSKHDEKVVDNAIDEFIESVLEGYSCIEWRGKTYIASFKEQKNENNV